MLAPPENQQPRGGVLAWAPRIAATGVALLAASVLVGWQFGIETLKRILPQWVAMNPATALLFLLGAASLWILGEGGALRRWKETTVRLLAGIMVAFGLIRFIGVLGGPDLHLDQQLYNLSTGTEAITDAATRMNRVAPNTAVLFVLIGSALLLTTVWRRSSQVLAKALAVVASFIALIAIVGYFNGMSALYRPTLLTPMAVHSAAGFLLLAAGLFLRNASALFAADHVAEDLSAVQRKVTLGFGAALFLLVLIGVISNAGMLAFLGAAQQTEQSQGALTAIAELSGSLSAAESEARGYALTGETRARTAYELAAAAVPGRLATLQQRLSHDPRQQERVTELRPLIERELGQFQQLVETGPAALLAATAGAGPFEEADHIRQLLAEVRETETALQQQRARDDGRSYHVTTIIITGGIAMALALVGVAGWVIRRDLSLKQAVAEELRVARLAAEAANESKGQFLANMSHEIRTPMAAIIGYADLLLDRGHPDELRAEYARTIRRNGDHLLTIINDILDLSKIDAGKLEVERLECCPCQVLSDVASVMRVRAAEKKLKLEIRNEGPIPATIRSDPARLRQILINLLGNAVKFTEEGWVRLIMRLLDTPHGPRLRFDVIDTGMGMTAEQVGRLFHRFVQADSSTTRRFGGTGLGLTICKRLAEMLGGEIQVDSFPGRGSTFSLIIDPGPLEGVRRLQNCREALTGTERVRAGNVPRLNARVLLVDDGEDNRRLLTTYLTMAGAEVTTAENGRLGVQTAIDAASGGKPFDLILMDMQMPVLDGYGASRLLRSQGCTAPIVALTANAMAEDCDKCLAAGCTDYLSKPVRRETLVRTLAGHLEGQAETTGPAIPDQPVAAQAEAVRSVLDDPSLQPLVAAYVASLPLRMAELEASVAAGDLERLASDLHNLKGTGGLFGLMPLSDAAEGAEELLRAQASLDRIGEQVRNIVDLARRVQG
jgi:signal transduction histidine kinase/DNA-binding response OmpR family regulator